MDTLIKFESTEYQASDKTVWTIRPTLIPKYGDDLELCRYRLECEGEKFEIEVSASHSYLSVRGVREATQEEIDQGYNHNIEDLKKLFGSIGLTQVRKIIDSKYRDLLGSNSSLNIFSIGNKPVARLLTKNNGKKEVDTWQID